MGRGASSTVARPVTRAEKPRDIYAREYKTAYARLYKQARRDGFTPDWARYIANRDANVVALEKSGLQNTPAGSAEIVY
jgi:hypothetical protein